VERRQHASTWSRRALLGATLLGGVTPLACGSDSGRARTPPRTDPRSSTVVEHRFGRTAVPSRPERIVALGAGDLETAIALRAPVVAGADMFGHPRLRPWARNALAGLPEPEVLDGRRLALEEIARLRPDLILYVNSETSETEYRLLSKLAPTVAAPPGTVHPRAVSWRDQLRIIGAATGRATVAQAVRRRVEGDLLAQRRRHPEFSQRTINAGFFSGGQVTAWLPGDRRMGLLLELGFRPAGSLPTAGRNGESVVVPDELLTRLDADVLLLAAVGVDGRVAPDLLDLPLYRSIPAVAEGRVAYLPDARAVTADTPAGDFGSAFAIGGALGISTVLDPLCEVLAEAAAR
jgi:iron complex transport system substrate-binding protein